MCYAPRKQADAFHFLGLAILLLGFLALGDVFGGAHNPVNLPRRIAHRKSPVVNPAQSAIGPDDSIGFIVISAFLFGQRSLEDALPVVGMNRFEPAWGR